MCQTLEYPMTHMKRNRLERQIRRQRREHWDMMNERLNSGEPINFPITTTEELYNEKP